MATVKPIKPKKPVDYVGHEPVMLGVSKAKAMAWVLEQLGAPDGCNNLQHALADAGDPKETHEWLHSVVGEALRAALDDIETEYRKLGTNLLQKEATQAGVERLLRPPTTRSRRTVCDGDRGDPGSFYWRLLGPEGHRAP